MVQANNFCFSDTWSGRDNRVARFRSSLLHMQAGEQFSTVLVVEVVF
jgi:hypothetical protein